MTKENKPDPPLDFGSTDWLGRIYVAPGPTGYSLAAVEVAVRAAYANGQAAERERWQAAAEMAVQELAGCATWTAGGVACQALRDVLRA